MARTFRAEMFHDKMVDEVDEIDGNLDKDEIANKKLKIDSLKWLTEKNDQKRYGAAKKIESGNAGEALIKIVVNTGINRDNTESDIITISTEE
jgi:hypothetical protein